MSVSSNIEKPGSANVILFAEDDDNYALILQCTFKEAGINHDVFRVPDGAEAIAYLKGEGKYSDRSQYPFPCVVLADIKMPKITGMELLQWVRSRSDFGHLPVVMLTSSDELRDVKEAYTLGANSFLMKPARIADLKELLKALEKYWTKFNVLDTETRLR
jgi:CheY-like chemotaxis protein